MTLCRIILFLVICRVLVFVTQVNVEQPARPSVIVMPPPVAIRQAVVQPPREVTRTQQIENNRTEVLQQDNDTTVYQDNDTYVALPERQRGRRYTVWLPVIRN